MTDTSMTTSAAGRKGGKSRSAAKLAAVRANGSKGGRPTLREQAERRVNNSPVLVQYHDFIMSDWPEGNEHWRWVITAKVSDIANWALNS